MTHTDQNKGLRERYWKFMIELVGETDEALTPEDEDKLFAFLEEEIDKARQEEREEMKQYCLNCIPSNILGTASMMVEIEHDIIRTAINNLK